MLLYLLFEPLLFTASQQIPDLATFSAACPNLLSKIGGLVLNPSCSSSLSIQQTPTVSLTVLDSTTLCSNSCLGGVDLSSEKSSTSCSPILTALVGPHCPSLVTTSNSNTQNGPTLASLNTACPNLVTSLSSRVIACNGLISITPLSQDPVSVSATTTNANTLCATACLGDLDLSNFYTDSTCSPVITPLLQEIATICPNIVTGETSNQGNSPSPSSSPITISTILEACPGISGEFNTFGQSCGGVINFNIAELSLSRATTNPTESQIETLCGPGCIQKVLPNYINLPECIDVLVRLGLNDITSLCDIDLTQNQNSIDQPSGETTTTTTTLLPTILPPAIAAGLEAACPGIPQKLSGLVAGCSRYINVDIGTSGLSIGLTSEYLSNPVASINSVCSPRGPCAEVFESASTYLNNPACIDFIGRDNLALSSFLCTKDVGSSNSTTNYCALSLSTTAQNLVTGFRLLIPSYSPSSNAFFMSGVSLSQGQSNFDFNQLRGNLCRPKSCEFQLAQTMIDYETNDLTRLQMNKMFSLLCDAPSSSCVSSMVQTMLTTNVLTDPFAYLRSNVNSFCQNECTEFLVTKLLGDYTWSYLLKRMCVSPTSNTDTCLDRFLRTTAVSTSMDPSTGQDATAPSCSSGTPIAIDAGATRPPLFTTEASTATTTTVAPSNSTRRLQTTNGLKSCSTGDSCAPYCSNMNCDATTGSQCVATGNTQCSTTTSNPFYTNTVNCGCSRKMDQFFHQTGCCAGLLLTAQLLIENGGGRHADVATEEATFPDRSGNKLDLRPEPQWVSNILKASPPGCIDHHTSDLSVWACYPASSNDTTADIPSTSWDFTVYNLDCSQIIGQTEDILANQMLRGLLPSLTDNLILEICVGDNFRRQLQASSSSSLFAKIRLTAIAIDETTLNQISSKVEVTLNSGFIDEEISTILTQVGAPKILPNEPILTRNDQIENVDTGNDIFYFEEVSRQLRNIVNTRLNMIIQKAYSVGIVSMVVLMIIGVLLL